MSQANELTARIISHICSNGGYAFRASSQGLWDRNLNAFRMAAKKGISDVLGLVGPSGRLLAVEVKIGKDVLSPEQDGFGQNIVHCGGLFFVAKDFDSFRLWFDDVLFQQSKPYPPSSS